MKPWLALIALGGSMAMGDSPAPRYLTFKGTIQSFRQDDGGLAASRGMHVGDSVSFAFKVDSASIHDL